MAIPVNKAVSMNRTAIQFYRTFHSEYSEEYDFIYAIVAGIVCEKYFFDGRIKSNNSTGIFPAKSNTNLTLNSSQIIYPGICSARILITDKYLRSILQNGKHEFRVVSF